MACYSPSLTIQSGHGTPTFKGGVPTPKSTWMPRHPCLPRFEFSDVTSQGVWLSLSDTCGWDEAYLCPRYPKKSRPVVKKTIKKRKSKKPRKRKEKENGRGRVAQRESRGSSASQATPRWGDLMVLLQSTGDWVLRQPGNTPHSRVGG